MINRPMVMMPSKEVISQPINTDVFH